MRANGAAWMIRLGAFLILCTPPLDVLTERLFDARVEFRSIESVTITSGRYTKGAKPIWAGGIALVGAMTFLLGSILNPSLRLARATVLASLVFLAMISLAAQVITGTSWALREPLAPPWIAAGLPGLGGVALALIWGWKVQCGRLMKTSRMLMALGLCWLVLLEWSNRLWRPDELGMLAAFAGGLLAALGELLQRDAPLHSSTVTYSVSAGKHNLQRK